ncbi:MAG: ATP-dependent zinc metalloprotease FtsH, partial [Sciscionella sp.]
DKELMTRSEMIGRLVFALGGRSAEELVFHEPTTGASSDIEQATKIAKAMVTEYGMSAKLGAVKYGQEQGDPFLGRSAGRQPDYSLEVAHEIDEEVRKLIEAAHTEAWSVLDTYRDVLDNLVLELLDRETLHRKDLARIFEQVEKRPRITDFNDFGGRTPSDKPPVKTPAERAKERGEPWPPIREERPTPVGALPGAGELPSHGNPQPGPNGSAPGGRGGYGQPGGPPGGYPGGQPGGYPGGYPQGTRQNAGSAYPGNDQQGTRSGNHNGPPNYGAPPGWTPATNAGDQTPSWTPSWEHPPSDPQDQRWFGSPQDGQQGGENDNRQQPPDGR